MTPLSVERDSTERRRLTRALHESELRFRSLVEQPLAGIFILRRDRLEYVNPLCARIFGYTVEEMVQRVHITNLLAEEDRATMRELIRRRLEGDASHARHVMQATRSNGERVELEVHGFRTEMEGEPAFVGMLQDITERKKAEAALREREEQLRHAQKLEAVGRLAGGIAHDFNNLLMVIQGSVNLILMDPDAENPHRADLEEIVRATERAAGLTRQLLAFGRRQVLRPKLVNLNSVVEDLNKMMRRVIGEDIELRTVLDPTLWTTKVDPGQLEHVMLNLLVNSRDAMPEGGTITIQTENGEITADDAQRFPYQVVPGEYVRLSVEDTGSGMPESVRARVFEPFFTTKPQGRGTGLGLSMVYGIIKQSGGYIWVSSEVGQGTRFEIYLPRVDGAVESTSSSRSPVVSRGSGTVLLVEDEEPVRTVTRRLLEHAGYHVLEASSGPEAMRIFESCAHCVDLLLTDVVMPGMGGRELAALVREKQPELPVLYMSGYANNRRVRRGSGRSDEHFIQKPFTPDRLVELIREVVAR